MKRFLLIVLLVGITEAIGAQCNATNIATGSPVTSNDSGFSGVNLFNNEYALVNGLNIGDFYTLSIPENWIYTAYFTVRDPADNSVIASGSAPLTFQSVTLNIEIHYFLDNSCNSSGFGFIPLIGINESTLGQENLNEDSLNIFPIPTKDYLNINSNTLKLDVVNIYDLKGVRVKELKNLRDFYRIDLRNFSKGIYILEITSGNRNFIKRIVKK